MASTPSTTSAADQAVREERLCQCGNLLPALTALEVTWTAPLCQECGAVALAEQLAAEAASRERRLLEGMGAGRLIDTSLATYPRDPEGLKALGKAHEWLDRPVEQRRNLLLYGPVGCGKTGLAWGILRELADRELARYQQAVDAENEKPFDERGEVFLTRPGLLVVWRDLLDQLRDTFEFGGPCALLDKARNTKVLALDDLGAERPTEFAIEELQLLVEHRYQHRLPTIVTSNYTPEGLVQRLGRADEVIGQRIVSRLAGHEADAHRFDGVDRRLG